MWKKFLSKQIKYITLILVLMIFSGCVAGFDVSALKPESTEIIVVEVLKGETVTSVAKKLEGMNLIKNRKSFVNFAKKNNLTNIKAGKYQFSPAMTGEKMLKDLVNGNVYRGEKIVIPEGFQLNQIAERLEKNGIAAKDDFMKAAFQPENFSMKYEFLKSNEQENLEGYLYPNTYFFEKNMAPNVIINEMLSEFDKVYRRDLKPLVAKSKLNINQAVILASVIEKEAVLEQDREIISSVFYNRLEKKMRLQSDATVQYALKERKDRVLYTDLKVDSPYNTYKVSGLPAGAISNPGKNSLIAALQPAQTEYLFFLTKNDGSNEAVYAKTYEQHLKNKEQYLD